VSYQQQIHQQQMKTLFDKLMETQAELRELKPQPSITIKTRDSIISVFCRSIWQCLRRPARHYRGDGP
jgi:hypothetical protein